MIQKTIIKNLKIKISCTDYNEDKDMGKQFLEIYNQCKDYTITPKARMHALYEAVLYVLKAKIPGAFVECGVFRGGSSMLMAATLKRMNAKRQVYLYDTFKGMPSPTNRDRIFPTGKQDIRKCRAGINEVENNMARTGHPGGLMKFIEGMVEDTIPEHAPDKIALLRLDTDFYNSTKHELKHLYPRLSVGGVLIIDDYGYMSGAREAVSEYFKDRPILLTKTDHGGGRIGVKMF